MNLKNHFINFKEIIIESKYQNKYYELYENNTIIKKDIYYDKIIITKINLDCFYYIQIDNVKIEIFKHHLYDTLEFNKAYNYNDKLGCIINEDFIEFKVFAPTQYNLTLNIYKTGHNNDLVASFKMQKDKGIFKIIIDKLYEDYYYTYNVLNFITNEVVEVIDPYAIACGLNGKRALITDLKSTTKIKTKRPQRKFCEAIVYEIHTKDLTSDPNWNGHEKYKGKFLGLCEENTTYKEDNLIVKTGFDHIKELGVTDIQLLPIFNFISKEEYNWGYMPLNFNCLEESYSTNAYDALVRINEFKNVVIKYNESNIGVIMDVVYNHTALSDDSNFNILVPGYYHRLFNDEFSNASACGNETASQRFMMRKFIVDSTIFLAKEYNLSGFRFDLMEIHDIDTMNLISNELKKIDSSIIIYGEPWKGCSSSFDSGKLSSKINIKNLNNIGAFNDVTRDAIKGSVFDVNSIGYVQGNTSIDVIEKVKYGINGGFYHHQINSLYIENGFWHMNKCVNYCSAHDNNTLWDKLTLSTNASIEEKILMQKQANCIILLSKGLSFLHGGVEICRSKPIGNKLDENSYKSGNDTNMIRWENKIKYYDVFLFYKKLITFRKNIFLKLVNIDFKDNNYISYEIDNFLIIFNNNKENIIKLKNNYDFIMFESCFINNKMALIGDFILKKNNCYILKIKNTT